MGLAIALALALTIAPTDGFYSVEPGVNMRVVEIVAPERCQLSGYGVFELAIAEAGGMRLRAHMHETGGDWVGCAIYTDRLTLVPGDAFVLRWGDTEARSIPTGGSGWCGS